MSRPVSQVTLRRVADAEWMLDQGEWPERAAARVGWTLATLTRQMQRYSRRTDLLRLLYRTNWMVRAERRMAE